MRCVHLFVSAHKPECQRGKMSSQTCPPMKVSIFPWCNSQSAEGRKINHCSWVFVIGGGSIWQVARLQNSDSLNSARHSLRLRYTKQSLSPTSLLCSMWAAHWTSSQKPALNTPAEGKAIFSPPPWTSGTHSQLPIPGIEEKKYWLEMMMHTQEKLHNTHKKWHWHTCGRTWKVGSVDIQPTTSSEMLDAANPPSWLQGQNFSFPVAPHWPKNAQKGLAREQLENLSHVLFIGRLNQGLEAGKHLRGLHSVSEATPTDFSHSSPFEWE